MNLKFSNFLYKEMDSFQFYWLKPPYFRCPSGKMGVCLQITITDGGDCEGTFT